MTYQDIIFIVGIATVIFVVVVFARRSHKKAQDLINDGEKTLARYRCFKTVRAVKIGAVHGTADGGANLIPDNYFHNATFDVITVSREYVSKHKPLKDGYYVRYEDGYESFSPAKAFEEGYELIK